MTGLQLKTQIALYIPETLSVDLTTAFFENSFRSLSLRLPHLTQSDVTGLAVTATSLDLPVSCIDFEVESVKINGEYVDPVLFEDRQFFEDSGVIRFYVLGRKMYFTAPIGYTTVTLFYRVAYVAPADGAVVTLSEPMIKILSLLFMREYYVYVRGLVSMKRENAPDISSDEIEKLIKNLNSDIDRECSFFSV